MNYYDNIKEKLINNEIVKRVKDYSKNKSDLDTYYEVGKLLVDAGKHYGEGIIKQYSIKLKQEVSRKYSITSLKYIRQFYVFAKSHSVSDQLSFTHYKKLIPLKDVNIINYYIDKAISNNLSVRELEKIIKLKEYERLPIESRNKLINKEEKELVDFIPNPIIIKNKYNTNDISEKVLKSLILEDIQSFLEELGDDFCFKKSEYKIKIGNRYNYVDLLLFNTKYNCYVVVELKITELKKEHIGQIQVYMNYIDKNVKEIFNNKTIGLIICKKDNKFIIEYSSDPRIYARFYVLK